MKTYTVRTLEGEIIEISEFDIKHLKMVKNKDKYQIHLLDRILNVDKSVIKMFSFIYPYIKLINI